jgi:hypothetical protein
MRKRKKLFLISALLFSFNGWAEDINGSMRCTIKDQIIIEMVDGVTKRYAALEDNYKVGDSVPFTYEYDEQSSELNIMLGKTGKGFFVNTFDTKTTTNNQALKETVEKITGISSPKRYFVYQGAVNRSVFSINADSISAEMGSVFDLHLQRYFKNDWSGIYTSIVSDATHVVVVDCRQGINRLDELLEVLDDLAEENE